MENLTTLAGLENMKVVKSTGLKIRLFLYENRKNMTPKMQWLYSDIAGLVEHNSKKKSTDRTKIKTMERIIFCAQNLDKMAFAAGAISVETHTI